MKKQYMQPELGTKHYAQFENVFTACSKGEAGQFNHNNEPCMQDSNPSKKGPNRAAYSNNTGSN